MGGSSQSTCMDSGNGKGYSAEIERRQREQIGGQPEQAEADEGGQ